MKPIPASTVTDSLNYLLFISDLRTAFNNAGMSTSLSIAAPASFWYLKGFFIQPLGYYVDYVIYMTYDLHGQWDFNNKWSQPGCGGGNCLRSGVNLTETVNALSLITKAGVPSNKVVVGVTSYGRSFAMTTPGCSGEMCTYVGPDSTAAKGMCTGTSGYLANAEIDYAAATDPNAKHSVDNSYSDILVFGNNQWVSYMSDSNKQTRTSLYQALHFGGTTDWAVDLGGNKDSITSQCTSLSQSGGFFPTCTPAAPNTGCQGGTGDGDYKNLCAYSCLFGYCPQPFCTCTRNGPLLPVPVARPGAFCPAEGVDSSFSGLCSFACKFGYCPPDRCQEQDEGYCANPRWRGVFNEQGLKPDASCADIGNYGILTQSIWDAIHASDSLSDYVKNYNGRNFMVDLVNPLGIGQSSSGCQLIDEATCNPSNCDSNTRGFGWKYCVGLSLANLNQVRTINKTITSFHALISRQVMRALYTATGMMPPKFHARAQEISQTFTWKPRDDTLFWQEFMTALSTVLVVATTLTGNIALTAAGSALAGGLTAVLNVITQPKNVAQTDFTIEAGKWADGLKKAYVGMWDDINRGGKEIVPLLSHGAFLDYRQLPITRTDDRITHDQLVDHVLDIWDAAVVNKKWKEDNVFLYCYPMSKSVFDSHASKYQGDLQSWVDQDGGKGCYLQGISSGGAVIEYGTPPGSEKLGHDYPFTSADVIQSSYATFAEGGFNYTVPVHDNVQTVVALDAAAIAGGKLWRAAGTFNLPICDPSDQWSIDTFYNNLNYGGFRNVARYVTRPKPR
ncbi:hypothetical protein NLG97_g9776 [Lecanicillium saksenae]|uniref:Uncharacterized protein n=1 Tax=Lecanicillium saksenae TaxID=468837 RepID=A0ACC1QFA8_9HYPO|nr:hypothetical protein NLG97_g9776 [Lecanicillium saksenae]